MKNFSSTNGNSAKSASSFFNAPANWEQFKAVEDAIAALNGNARSRWIASPESEIWEEKAVDFLKGFFEEAFSRSEISDLSIAIRYQTACFGRLIITVDKTVLIERRTPKQVEFTLLALLALPEWLKRNETDESVVSALANLLDWNRGRLAQPRMESIEAYRNQELAFERAENGTRVDETRQGIPPVRNMAHHIHHGHGIPIMDELSTELEGVRIN